MNAYTLIPVTAPDAALQAVLENLTKMYCYEWSQYTGMEVDEQGRYVFEKYLPTYWQRPDRKAFLLRCEQKAAAPRWAGFALMDQDFICHPDFDYSLAEFFVMHKYRRHGAGRWMAQTLFARYPGRWELGRNPKNQTAYAFWEHVVADFTAGRYELTLACPAHRYADGTLGDVFAFDSAARRDRAPNA